MPPTVTASSRITGKAAKSPESYSSLKTRMDAAETLQSYERLSWMSFQRCESITQTRLHFQNVIAGFTSEDEAKYIDYKTDLTPLPTKPGEEAKVSRKGKERQSAGGGDGIAGSSTVASPAGAKGKQAREKGNGL
ncbi:hypothetical protein B0A50_01113 [Salinomyces thailandicus]|uniref:Uncharacterized protein n=1 Tax=Salinomyces thailandicus TaxID=706561 RepID=A0A4U0UCG9_9PEZI|nr:hypothetical protein B0A50_01113 [Salinomyces thailandica]